ncbi:MAG: ribosomal RNA small subunit methyltransferase A [Desulfobacteraceae bacterium]|nr:ribosomal RNA small subunit methyltransferase A [Desulfobacteraceae bacterium]
MTHPGQLLKKEKLYAGKEMGQNFLSDPGTAQRIVDRTGISGDTIVLEIGPGLGALTIPLARKAGRVIAVELDRRMVPLLKEELEQEAIDNVTVINQNIMKTDFKEIAGDKKLVVVGNLPYNISSQILFRLVKERSSIEKAFLMFQKELATRIIASPGGRDYSRLSAVVQYAAKVGFVADIKPSSFFPKPDVDSTVLRFDFLDSADMSPPMEDLLFDVIKSAFSKRRKSLKNSMVGGELGLEKPDVVRALILASIAPERRAETLSVAEFKALAIAVWQLRRET